MNLVLFERGELDAPLARSDPRAEHIVRILRRRQGDTFDAGIVNGPRGKATLASLGREALVLRFEALADPEPPDAIHVLTGFPRPQTARRILSDASSLGVASLAFFPTEKGEPSYASSTLWSREGWRRHLVDGAAQAFDTRIPELRRHASLGEAIAALPAEGVRRALDNYEAPNRLDARSAGRPLALAFGAERGWSQAERDLLRASGFELAHLGPRVLRTETAVVAALAVAKSGA